jgi:predicted ATPase
LREVVADRVQRLPRASAELLQWAAVLGGHCEVEVLAALTRTNSPAEPSISAFPSPDAN